MNANNQRDEMLRRLRASLRRAEGHMHHLRREDAGLVYASLAASSQGTIVAGLTATLLSGFAGTLRAPRAGGW